MSPLVDGTNHWFVAEKHEKVQASDSNKKREKTESECEGKKKRQQWLIVMVSRGKKNSWQCLQHCSASGRRSRCFEQEARRVHRELCTVYKYISISLCVGAESNGGSRANDHQPTILPISITIETQKPNKSAKATLSFLETW